MIRRSRQHLTVSSAIALMALGGIAVAFSLVATLIPAEAEAEPVKSTITAEVFGVIDRHATVGYFFNGTVNAQGFTFGCMEGREVVLFRVEPDGTHRRVAAAETKLLGSFLAPLEKSLNAIPGSYYAKVKPRIRKLKKGKLRCLPARTPAFRVEVPTGLLTTPVLPLG